MERSAPRRPPRRARGVPGARLRLRAPPGGGPARPVRAAFQAFRLENAWGLQFHPEPTVEMLESWIRTIEADMRRNGSVPAEVAYRARQQVPVWAERAWQIARGFAQAVMQRERALRLRHRL